MELAKAYDITKKQQKEYFRSNSPENRYFRLYVVDEKGNGENKAVIDLDESKGSARMEQISARTSRRKINYLSNRGISNFS